MVKIYTLEDPRNGQIRYVGKTKQTLQMRYYSHVSFYKLQREKSHKNSWILQLLKLGLKPIIKLVEEVNESEWQDTEMYWISQLKVWGYNLTNMTKGGESGNGGKGCLGYKHTEEAKRNISIKNSKPKSQEWIDNVANSMRKSTAKPIVQITLSGEFIKRHESFYTACLEVNVLGKPTSTKKNIHACCNGKRKTAYGFIWKYEDVELRDKEPLG